MTDEGARNLATAILICAVKDRCRPRGGWAARFMKTAWYRDLCELAGVDPDAFDLAYARTVIERLTAKRAAAAQKSRATRVARRGEDANTCPSA